MCSGYKSFTNLVDKSPNNSIERVPCRRFAIYSKEARPCPITLASKTAKLRIYHEFLKFI